jgi:hypothetical protein
MANLSIIIQDIRTGDRSHRTAASWTQGLLNAPLAKPRSQSSLGDQSHSLNGLFTPTAEQNDNDISMIAFKADRSTGMVNVAKCSLNRP